MAFRAKDGRAFGNRQKMNAYNERSSTKEKDAKDERSPSERKEHGGSLEPKPHQPPGEVESAGNPAGNPNPGPSEPAPSSPEPGANPGEAAFSAGETGGGEGDLSHMNINDVVRQHGPADTVQIRRSGGMHHVTSTHGGRRHVTSHPTPHSAALHVGDSMGLNQAMTNMAANPQMEDQIPGIRRT